MLSSPHLYFGLLKAVRHKVDILKCCDDAFLFGCNFGVKRHYPCIARESMLEEKQFVIVHVISGPHLGHITFK